MKLGKLTEVDIRKVWAHEQYDFSKWLSREENIKELGDALGLTLVEVETEKFVGNYRCDILCKEDAGKVVLVENQLEITNHDHLGKLITYASGLDASVVVWIVASAREEHISAIEWLNKHTSEDLSFFLLEIHAYKIGNSSPAPQFKIVVQPNNFSKNMQTISRRGGLSESEEKRFEFWTLFNQMVDDVGKPFNKHKPSANHWYNVAVGVAGCHVQIDLINTEHKIRVSFWIDNDKELFDQLHQNKKEIEKAFGAKLIWERLDKKIASRVSVHVGGLDFEKQGNYKTLMKDVIGKVVKLKEAFKLYL